MKMSILTDYNFAATGMSLNALSYPLNLQPLHNT